MNKMHSLPLFLAFFLMVMVGFSQKDSIDLKNSNQELQFDQLKEGTNTYLVYFQDSLSGPRFNMEIWNRTIDKVRQNDQDLYHFRWNRYFSNGSFAKYDIMSNGNTFAPISEKMHMQRLTEKDTTVLNRYFIYSNNTIQTSSNTSEHNGKPFRLDNLADSFNWEMDMETFSMLPLESGKTYAINFYHPGSSTLPNYYEYKITGSEEISFDTQTFDCWTLEIEYPENHGKSTFWIEKGTHTVVKMKEVYDGVYRFKLLLPS